MITSALLVTGSFSMYELRRHNQFQHYFTARLSFFLCGCLFLAFLALSLFASMCYSADLESGNTNSSQSDELTRDEYDVRRVIEVENFKSTHIIDDSSELSNNYFTYLLKFTSKKSSDLDLQNVIRVHEFDKYFFRGFKTRKNSILVEVKNIYAVTVLIDKEEDSSSQNVKSFFSKIVGMFKKG